jgi:hypothetical protein
MKCVLLAAILSLGIGSASAQVVSSPAGPYQGTGTNDNAAAGQVGEYVSAEVLAASAIPLTTGTAANVTSISLTAGDWDVRAAIGFNPNGATTISELVGAITTTSATVPTPPASSVAGYSRLRLSFTTGAADSFALSTVRLSLASTSTVYLVAQSAFATNTQGAYGKLEARRAR